MSQRCFPLLSMVRVALTVAVAFHCSGEIAARNLGVKSPNPRLPAILQRDLEAYLKERSAKEHLSSLSLAVSLGRDQPTINVTAGRRSITPDQP